MFALAFALGVYLLLTALRPQDGLIGFSFLLVLPAAIAAFVAYVGDPWNERTGRYYRLVAVWLMVAAMLLSFVALREGILCIIILAPIWFVSSLAGAELTYRIRLRFRRSDPEAAADPFRAVAFLVVPLVMIQVEPAIRLPQQETAVTRSILVRAAPEQIWPLLEGVPDVRPSEGRWNLTQDVIGVPRPLGAQLVGRGIGADRLARWDDGIHFRERITVWQPGRAIGWRFIFDDSAGWDFADPHLRPDSRYFRILDGGYRMERVAPGLTRVTLSTRYRIRTPVNAYCALWGELFLGDMETNLLALIRSRAEGSPLPPPP